MSKITHFLIVEHRPQYGGALFLLYRMFGAPDTALLHASLQRGPRDYQDDIWLEGRNRWLERSGALPDTPVRFAHLEHPVGTIADLIAGRLEEPRPYG